MGIRTIAAFILALALAAPQAAEAATAKKKSSAKSSSSSQLRKIGDGPLGSFVDAPDSQIFANIVGFIYGLPTIGYEQALTDDNSWTGQVGFRSQGSTGWSINYLGVVGSYRWWVGEHAKMQGVYVGPFGTVQMVNVNYDVTTVSGTFPFTTSTKKESATSFIFGAGAEGGYQWILPASFTFSAGLNAGYYFGSLSLGSGAPSIPFGGFGAGLNGTVGYAF